MDEILLKLRIFEISIVLTRAFCPFPYLVSIMVEIRKKVLPNLML
jgi:hypothetical protein